MFTVKVDEWTIASGGGEPATRITRFEQTVDIIDLPKLIAAVNARPRKPRVKKETK